MHTSQSGTEQIDLDLFNFCNLKLHGFIQKTKKKSYQGISPKTKIQKLQGIRLHLVITNLKFCGLGNRLHLTVGIRLRLIFHIPF